MGNKNFSMDREEQNNLIDELAPIIKKVYDEYSDASDFKRCHMIAYKVVSFLNKDDKLNG